jgi:uncharacterized protein (TIGR02118 family)
MFKVLILLKRRPGMSVEEFRDYYEGVHSKLGEKHASGMRRYIRRYVQPVSSPFAGQSSELDFDVVTELWYDDRAAFERAMQRSSGSDVAAEIAADEERLFDRSKTRFATVVELESDPAVLGRARE